ncbi:predicted protein [Chaetomium globosum CBS 148.51]|uniref:Uncharacterized protein n=1 Tax=Chaetomium globosum (strain ATCC 6205 / CBS 148.51 / DSM 1962 / NBRC 6347 / NRRL 1970) TaxID=306901 RepID=Q2GPW4_CHAGB|nr:uncharacterized protein CHGG_09990 [Chaetomium globosum CBS 148.51]EAQ83586.1 predicted protein [Chaetomium globosum CBS 148.51]
MEDLDPMAIRAELPPFPGPYRGYRPPGLPVQGESPGGPHPLLRVRERQGDGGALGGLVPRPAVTKAGGIGREIRSHRDLQTGIRE